MSRVGQRANRRSSIMPEHEGLVRSGLECAIGRRRVAIPLEVAGRVIEIDIAPLPLSRERISGVAAHEGELLLCLSLANEERAVLRHAQGVVLSQANDRSVTQWALEVSSVIGLTELELEASPEGATGWIRPARTRDGRAVHWFDVSALLRHLETLSSAPAGAVR
jgi:chemotaxis signal transduction protein